MFKEFQLATSEEVYGSQFPYKYQVSHDISSSYQSNDSLFMFSGEMDPLWLHRGRG